MTELKVFTVPEAATILKTTRKTIYRLLMRGKLKSIGCLRHKRILASSLQNLINNNGE